MGDKVSVYINKKLIDDIKSFCKLNNKNYLEYITDVLESKLALDMYGDLNEKIKPKKRTPLKKVEEVKKEEKEVLTEIPLTTNEPVSIEEPTISILVKKEDKPKTKRRTLNSK